MLIRHPPLTRILDDLADRKNGLYLTLPFFTNLNRTPLDRMLKSKTCSTVPSTASIGNDTRPNNLVRGELMNRFIASFAKLLLAILIAGGTLATDLHAQSDEITVNVPFAFIVGTHTISPGTYRFSLMSSEFLLSVVNTKTGDKQIF